MPQFSRALFMYLSALCWAASSTNSVLHAEVLLPVEAVTLQKNKTNLGYGIIVRDGPRCFVVTPAHVAGEQKPGQKLEDRFRLVYAVSELSGGATLEMVTANDKDDLYVGSVPPGKFTESCSRAQQIEKLEKDYRALVTTGREREFKSIKLVSRVAELDFAPRYEDSLKRLANKDELQYVRHSCVSEAPGPTCNQPVKGMSGSPIWYFSGTSGSQSIFLGLHRQRCDADCEEETEFWKGISVFEVAEMVRQASAMMGFNSVELDQNANLVPKLPNELSADETDLMSDVQRELARLKCEPGKIDGKYGDGTQHAMSRVALAYGIPNPAKAPTNEYLAALKALVPSVCPSICKSSEQFKDGRCVKTLPKKAPRPTSTIESSRGCETINGLLHCKQ